MNFNKQCVAVRLLMAVLCATSVGFGASAAAQTIDGIKCIVSGNQNANRDFKTDYAEGEVYFCCQSCKETFVDATAASKKDFVVKANHQLVLTGQYVQSACPVSGSATSLGHRSNVAGVEVAYCCENCQSKIEELADTKAKAEMVFGGAPFAKSFVKKKIDLSAVMCPLMQKTPVKAELAAEYGDGEVYLCCPKCVKTFQDTPAKFATAANYQLAQTEQYEQSKCPINGGKIDTSKTAKVGDLDVAFCCDKCQRKVDSASDEAEKMEMVFSPEAFDKSFTAKK